MLISSLLMGAGDMISTWVQAEEGLHHHSHCLNEECLQLSWDQQLELLHFLEPLWKQAHDHQSALLIGRGRESNRDGFNDEGLWGRGMLFL